MTQNQLYKTESKIRSKSLDIHYEVVFFIFIILYVAVIYTYVMNKPKFLTNNGLFMTVRYTFTIESMTLKFFLYCNQLLVSFHSISLQVADCLSIMFMYTAAVRLKILNYKIEFIQNYGDLKRWIREHQELLRYAAFKLKKKKKNLLNKN